jgi:hypothetical protein
MNVDDARERVSRVEAALEAVEAMPAQQRDRALDAIHELLELYGAGFARVLARLEQPDSTVRPAALAEDELVGHLLMVHGLHPLGFEDPQQVPGAPGGPPLVQLDGRPNGAARP